MSTPYFYNNSPLAYAAVALKPGTVKLEGYWFGSLKAGGSFERSPNWTFTQSSVLIDEFSSDGSSDCTNSYYGGTNSNIPNQNADGKTYNADASGDFELGDEIYFYSEFQPLKRQTVDFSPITLHQRDCDSFADSLTGVTPGKVPLVYYLQDTDTFRVPFDSVELGS